MKNMTKFLIAASASTLFTAGAHAYNVTATVTNTIALTETTPFSLGSVFIRRGVDITGVADSAPAYITIAPATGVATATVATADGDGGDSISKFVSLGGVQAGVLSISGAQPFGALTITTGTPTALVHSSGNPALPTIAFTSVSTSPASTITLDGTGSGQILVGGVFTAGETTSALDTTTYQDGTYTGTYAVTVSY